MPYVYILECADGSFYVGSTKDIEARVAEHNSDRHGATYTRSRRPVKLAWCSETERIDEAYALEKQIQGWRRDKRLALIEGRYSDLPSLSHTCREPPAKTVSDVG